MEDKIIADTAVSLDVSDMSDFDDPTYTPEMEKMKRKSVPDFFKVKTTKLNTESLCSSREFLIETTGTESQNISLKEEIMKKIEDCPYLDGKFFKLKFYEENGSKIKTECQLCLPKKVEIKGR